MSPLSRALPALALLALAACGEGEAAGPGQAQARQNSARQAAEAALRLRIRAPEQRGVQVFTQAMAENLVVCGRARATAADAFLPYVAIIGFTGDTPRLLGFHLGASGAEASRVYLAMTDRCFEGGGPANTRAMARNLPPLPETAPPEPALVAPAPAPGATTMISTRANANIRSAARGGEVLRSVPPATRLELISEAPGGWVQVGERGVPLGWVHGSLLER